jgi:hypothetical protein
MITIAGAIARTSRFRFWLFRNLPAKNLLFREITSEIASEIPNVMYRVDTNKTLEECLSLSALFFAMRQLSAVGTPVVVTDRQIMSRLNIIWYIPRLVSPRTLDKNILYTNPIILTTRFDIKRIMVETTKYGNRKKPPPS